MKKCTNCRALMSDDANFCPKCGANQSEVQPQKTVSLEKNSKEPEPVSKSMSDKTVREIYDDAVGLIKGKVENSEVLANVSKSINEKTVREIYDDTVGLVKGKIENSEVMQSAAQNANFDSLQKALYAGIALVAVSIFMPMIKIIGMIEFSLMDYGKPLGFFCLLLCGVMFLAARVKKYAFTIIAAHSMLVFLLMMYSHYSNEMQKSSFGALARAAVDVGAGIYLLIIGLLLVIGATLLCSLIESSGTITLPGIFAEYVKYVFKPVRLFGIPIPGILWIVALTIFIIYISSLSNPVKDFQRSMNRGLFGR